MIIEAKCKKCWEIFNPHSESEQDLVHLQTSLEEPCGGDGEVIGVWYQETYVCSNPECPKFGNCDRECARNF